MAKRATTESVGAAVDGPNYRAALNIIQTDIKRAKGAQSKAGGEAGQAWTRIEKMGVNKKGAQIAAGIIGMEESMAHDVIRTVVKICFFANMLPTADLMDIAERLGAGDDLDGDDGDDEGDEDDGGEPADKPQPKGDAPAGAEPELVADAAKESARAKPKADRVTPTEARKRAANHLRSVPTATSPSPATH